MTIKFNDFTEKKQAFAKATQEGSAEEQSAALNNMLEALAQDVQGDIMNQVNTSMLDRSIMQARALMFLRVKRQNFSMS